MSDTPQPRNGNRNRNGNGTPPPLDIAQELILERLERKADSGTARLLSHALRCSLMPTESEDTVPSVGPEDIANQYTVPSVLEKYKKGLDLKTLSDYKVVLSKKDGCRMLTDLGVQDLSENYLNRHLTESSYKSIFGRSPSSVSGRGRNKLLFTYREIVYFYTAILNKPVPEPLPELPESLTDYASEVDDCLE